MAFSESETRNIRDSLLANRERIKLFLSFHAYSQLLLTPYGYTSSKPADNAELVSAERSYTKTGTTECEKYVIFLLVIKADLIKRKRIKMQEIQSTVM